MRELLRRQETAAAILLVLAFLAGALQSNYFLDPYYLVDSIGLNAEAGLLALGMTFVVVSGNIDLSVASALALVACSVAKLVQSGVPMMWSATAGLCLGALLGALNGVIVAYAKVPSFLVTLATLALFRGVTQAMTRSASLALPTSFTGVDRIDVPFTTIPVPLAIFLTFAVILALVLHRSKFGRAVYAVGGNETAAAYAAVNPEKVKVLVFTLSGALASVAALILISRLGSARYDHARRMELDVITATVLGGASIYGGRGTMLGTVIALVLLAIVKTGMGLAMVSTEYQLAVIGTLLVVAVAFGGYFGRRR